MATKTTTFTVKITGSGTAKQIAAALYDVAKDIHNQVLFDDFDIEMEREDPTLLTEIKED